MGLLDEETAAYAKFHLEVIGCRYCHANLTDLASRKSDRPQEIESRRRRYFQSSPATCSLRLQPAADDLAAWLGRAGGQRLSVGRVEDLP